MIRELKEIVSIPSKYMNVMAVYLSDLEGVPLCSKTLRGVNNSEVSQLILSMTSYMRKNERDVIILKDVKLGRNVVFQVIDDELMLTTVLASEVPLRPALQVLEHVGTVLEAMKNSSFKKVQRQLLQPR